MPQKIYTHHLSNGMVLLGEAMDWLESAAFSLLIPAGCRYDPAGRGGLSNFACEMTQRGCGSRDSHQFVDDLELLGADTSSNVANAHTSFGGAMPHDSLLDTLSIYADLVRRPHLPADQIEDARLVCLQEVRSVEDDFSQQVFEELRMLRYGDPCGRAAHGSYESVESITADDVRSFFESMYRPNNTILSVAGKIDWPRLKDHVEQLFSDWEPSDPAEINEVPATLQNRHLPNESSQTHIGVAYESVPYSHKDYFQARGAVGVLSDGMSSRLFTEVREKRGLCYAVYASCHSLRDRGSVLCYAGTTTERAQETLDVLLGELKRLSDGIEADELDRLKAKIKSSLIMQQESSPARSSSMCGDWYHLGRIQTMDELATVIDNLSCESINAYLAEHPARDMKVVTLGADELEIPAEETGI